ncbi:MAG: chromosome segregation protein SMC, partial [Deltaproteobacteria bacterium]|nr:chromosome segregation protein SMC [Deltaproteobacteria bacterium]
MKIRKLEICGFKSFADKTLVEFNDGITGVVGPNGCGKSNIVDAIRWVMGEMSAKHLRGKSMEDVIFSGTQSRAPTGMAEVTLTFSSEGGQVPVAYANYSEIALTRRLYRSGESEYLINKQSCRLRDIQEFFLGTGVGTKAYSIIEQGKIGQILTSKPEERRLILEEAAGISKFKARKEAALRKIEATRQNLNRLSDILGELERQKNTLERQAQKAKDYQEIFEELKNLELHLSSLDYLEASTALAQVEKALQEIETQEAALSSQVNELENQLEARRLVLLEKDREYLKAQEELYEKNNALALSQTQVEYKSRESTNLLQESQKATEQIDLAKTRLSSLKLQIAELNESKVSVDLEWASAQENFHSLENQLAQSLEEEASLKDQLEASSQKQLSWIQALSENKHRQESLNQQSSQLASREAQLREEIETNQSLLNKNKQSQEGLEKSLSTLRQLKLSLSDQSQSLETQLKNKKEEQENFNQELNQIKEELTLKASRLSSLEDFQKSLEGYQEGVRQILARPSEEKQSIFGTVADWVETEPAYEAAVAAALGEKLQYILVKDQDAALEALQYLKDHQVGRVSCLPLAFNSDFNEEAWSEEKEEGVLGPLKDFVTLSQANSFLQQYLFAHTYLVDNLETALRLASRSNQTQTLVTLEGEILEPHGTVTGGKVKGSEEALLKNKREIKELQSLVARLKSKLETKNLELQEKQTQVKHLESSLE